MDSPDSATVLSPRQWVIGGFCFLTGLAVIGVGLTSQIKWPTGPLYYLLGILFLVQAADVAQVV